MSHCNRALGNLDRVDRRALARVGQVDHHAEPVHLADHLAAHPGDATVMQLHPAAAEQGLVVVGRLEKADAESVQHFDQAEIVLERHGSLQAKENSGAAALTGAVNVRHIGCEQDQVFMLAEAPVPVDNLLYGLPEILMVGDGHMDGCHLSLTHLQEDCSRPAAILQAVDQHWALSNRGAPPAW